MFGLFNLFKKKYIYPKRTIPQYSGYNLLLAEEIVLLRESLKQHVSPPPPDLIEHTSTRLVWRISLTGKEDQYMKYDKPNYVHDNDFLVYVDTELLYLLLLNDALISNDKTNYSCKLRRDLPDDDKYPYAEEGFSKGITWPVSLATINMDVVENKPSISFTDGITRTIWLIANYASSFPVYTNSLDSANNLNIIAGLTDEPISVCDMFKNT
ncbi:hypothetical protein MTZ49_10710 [Entomomonas sp. E2T0]|uniref:plasmid fertility inhibition factor family protein n=1 Tax=Entomomonas sp. E2T0 TaxID=2930213 RepID=UPI0022283807|nr:hypothetical protein [Entomomonas sp. E2T0]UYZ83073.1 hypothetical protein MTZ49_10710 [Entomomonas sp. E2T0]